MDPKLRYCRKALCKTKAILRLTSIVFLWTLLVLIYIVNDGSVWTIPHPWYVSDTEEPYVDRFPTREFGPNKIKVILVWTKYFGYEPYDWSDTVQRYLDKNCPKQCVVSKDRSILDASDALLFHFTDKDLLWKDMPPRRGRHQVWALYINEPNPSIQESFTPWVYVFNWTVSYRQHSTVFVPYGYARERSIYRQHRIANFNLNQRDKMAYAVVSKCADDAQRYKLIYAIKKFVPVDVYGYCGNMNCETAENTCLSKTTLSRYKFRLAFEDSNCRDYVTEKYWNSVKSDVIPVVDWKNLQMSPTVINHSYININDFENIRKLTDYMIKVGNSEDLYRSYFQWKTKYDVYDEHWDSICNFCKTLYDRGKPAQVYRDLEGWLRDDTCKRFTYQRLYRRYLDRFLYDGNIGDLLEYWKKRSGGST